MLRDDVSYHVSWKFEKVHEEDCFQKPWIHMGGAFCFMLLISRHPWKRAENERFQRRTTTTWHSIF